MNHNKHRKPYNGWRGQALAEYKWLVPLMAFALIVSLTYLGSIVTAKYQQVNDCFEDARVGVVSEDCSDGSGGTNNQNNGDEVASVPDSGDDGSPAEEDDSTPPEEDDSTPPEEDDSTPPEEDDSTPPEEDDSTPPEEDDSTPPEEDDSSSTGGSSSGGSSSGGSSSGGSSSGGSNPGGDDSSSGGGSSSSDDDVTGTEPEATEEPDIEFETGGDGEGESDAYQPECGEYTYAIVEPRENNAQHVMVQFPMECDEDGNPLSVNAGVSNMSVALGNNSYIRASLSGNISGSFNAWCVDYENPIYTGRDYTGDNYADPSVSVDRPQNLPLVNWLFNYNWQANGYEIMDVQGAIWLLIDSDPIRRSDIGDRAEELARYAIQQAGDSGTDATLTFEENNGSTNTIDVSDDISSGDDSSSDDSSGGYQVPAATTLDVATIELDSYVDPNRSSKWRAEALVTVLDNNGNPVEGVTVRIDFSRGGSNKTCQTDSNGQCSVETNRINSGRSSTTATVDTISNTGSLTYDASLYTPNSATANRP